MYTKAEEGVHELPGGGHPAAVAPPQPSTRSHARVHRCAFTHARVRAEELCVDTHRAPGAHKKRASQPP